MKHHYIPAFYLKGWTGADGRLCEHQRVHGRLVVDHRKFPDATGYAHDLYRVDHVPEEVAQLIESKFMHMVDTLAHRVLQKMLSGEAPPRDGPAMSSWVRFLLSLRFRNPEAVAALKNQMLALSLGAIEAFKERYQEVRLPTDPPTFEAYEARMEPGAPYVAAFQLFQQIIDNPDMGRAVFDMDWNCLALLSTLPLLTSDRPLVMPHGLSAGLILPLNPTNLFIAGPGGNLYRELASTNPTKVAKAINRWVVRQARKFVWGVDAAQKPFIEKWMSDLPDLEIITEEQKKRALAAAKDWRP
jgi:hypothetical protein